MPTSRDSRPASEFAAWLRTAMEAAGYFTVGNRPGGQAKLAADTEVATSIVSRTLAGTTVPDPETVILFAQTLDADPAEGLRLAGYPRTAGLAQKRREARRAAQPDAVLARIAADSELTDVQRAWLAGFYRRRRENFERAMAEEIGEVIDLLESYGTRPSGTLEVVERVAKQADAEFAAQIAHLVKLYEQGVQALAERRGDAQSA